MSGIEIVGLVFGAIAFAQTIAHVVNKSRQKTAITTAATEPKPPDQGPAKVALTNSSTALQYVRPSLQSQTQQSPENLAMKNLDAIGDMNRLQVRYNHATLQAMGQTHQSSVDFARKTLDTFGDMNRVQVRYNDATLQAMSQMYERQNNFTDTTIQTMDRMHNRFNQILMAMALTMAALTFCVGYYMAENNVLRSMSARLDLNNIGIPFPITPAHDVKEALPVDTPVVADELLTSVTTFGYGVVSGYLYVPLAALTLVLAPFKLAYTWLLCPIGSFVRHSAVSIGQQTPNLLQLLHGLLIYVRDSYLAIASASEAAKLWTRAAITKSFISFYRSLVDKSAPSSSLSPFAKFKHFVLTFIDFFLRPFGMLYKFWRIHHDAHGSQRP